MKKTSWLLIAFLTAAPAAAQAQEWSFSGTIYGWVPGIDLTVDSPFGSLEGGKSNESVLESIDMAFMASAEIRNGRWGLLGDFIYADLSGDRDTPRGLAFSDLKIDTKIAAFSGYAAYRLAENENIAFDLAGVPRFHRRYRRQAHRDPAGREPETQHRQDMGRASSRRARDRALRR